MTSKECDYLFKLVIIGSSGVGKTSLILRFADNYFTDNFISTIGIDFRIRTYIINDKIIKLQIWDTAGQERFRSITSAYYKSANAVIICYDVTSMDSFNNIDGWLSDLYFSSIPKLLIGNKCDLIDDRQVTSEIAQDYAKQHGCQFIATSAKTSHNIEEAFMGIVNELINLNINKPNSPIFKSLELNELDNYQSADKIKKIKCCFY